MNGDQNRDWELVITPQMVEAGLAVCSEWEVENVADLAGFVSALYRAGFQSTQTPPSQRLEANRRRLDRPPGDESA